MNQARLASTVGVLSLLAVGASLSVGASTSPRQAGVPVVAAPSAITNGSFEEGEGGAPAGWRRAQYQRGAEFAVDGLAHGGARSARISSAEGADAAWTVVALVRPYATYRLSGWIKTDAVEPLGSARGALLTIHGIEGLQTTPVTGTRDWTRVELTFDSGGNDSLQINCLLGGWGKVKGTAWYDDIALELVSARELSPRVIVDARRRRAPMSHYIYGQFIEHLGRCIYGGIWAEMLEDRKFYHAVGGPESPWKAAGGAHVVMSTREPFVGAHTPEVRVPEGKAGGLEQGDLALVAGKRYVGRVVIAGAPAAAPVRVSLVWGDAASARETITVQSLERGFVTVPLSFSSPVRTDRARLVIEPAGGDAALRVGTVSLMPADNVEGFRPDTLALLRELNAPVYRWPGGNFVSGYDWRDGIGDRDRRPPRKNPAWKGVEHNDVGVHEFMEFCRLVKAEPYIAVNSGLGDARAAAEEVEYANGPASSPMGRLRARNGHPEPYRCRWWSVGNEMYGDWQLGHMPLKEYIAKHNTFAEAMRSKDPSIRLVGVGAVGEWSEAMMTHAAGHMDLISEHFYSQERPGLMSHVAQIPRSIRAIAEAHRRYRRTIPALAGKDIRIALDEWNYWYGPHVYGELGTQYFLKDALGIAAGLHEYARQSDIVFMANYAQTVNVIGAIKTSKTEAVFDTTGLVLKLYRQRFGTIPIEIEGAPEPLDVAAAWREDGALTLAIVNATATEQALELQTAGAPAPAAVRAWRIAGRDAQAHNAPGQPPQVVIEELPDVPFGPRLRIPPLSVTIFEVGR
ncbi:MAG TPA: alpha-L-arabinofuranosidase C-terminal domain-containing protein [Vicinamibacterales bacterium]|nr:alpha-L-arabinofuranosidase C-terminal domain-containing protein [Vicinamibacterales bacterium]